MSESNLTLRQVQDALRTAFGGFVANGVLTRDEIEVRAEHLFQDLTILNLRDFCILPLEEVEELIDGQRIVIPVVGYTFGEKRQNLDASNPLHSPQEMSRLKYMEGIGLSQGDIIYLSRIAEIGRRTIPGLWLSDQSLRQDLELPNKHLSTLSEIWWLSLWPALDSNRIERAKQLQPPRDVDWSFAIRNGSIPGTGKDLVINLEVKDVLSSLEGAVHGNYASPLKDIFEGIERNGRHKFRASSENEINVVALTVPGSLALDIGELVQQRLRVDRLIDAVLLWTPFDRSQSF
jgi:hypothetical protein